LWKICDLDCAQGIEGLRQRRFGGDAPALNVNHGKDDAENAGVSHTQRPQFARADQRQRMHHHWGAAL
jgi:hypothetical protein